MTCTSIQFKCNLIPDRSLAYGLLNDHPALSVDQCRRPVVTLRTRCRGEATKKISTRERAGDRHVAGEKMYSFASHKR